MLLLLAGLAGCQPGPSEQASEAEPVVALTVTEQIAARLEAELGRTATPAIALDNSIEGWRFICGRPLETSGDAFDYQSSRLAEAAASGLVDDGFCALFETSADGARLREIVVGATDSPVIDWIERYGLSGELFSE